MHASFGCVIKFIVENCYELFGAQTGTRSHGVEADLPLARDMRDARLRLRLRCNGCNGNRGGGGVEAAGERPPPPPTGDTGKNAGDAAGDAAGGAALALVAALTSRSPSGGVAGIVCLGHRKPPTTTPSTISSDCQHPRSLQNVCSVSSG